MPLGIFQFQMDWKRTFFNCLDILISRLPLLHIYVYLCEYSMCIYLNEISYWLKSSNYLPLFHILYDMDF